MEEFSKKYVAAGKDREDRVHSRTNKFDSLHVEIRDPDTAILLLKCNEKSILLSAAAALSKFGEKAAENLETLFDLQTFDKVMPLLDHEDIFTRRFTMKLLSQMASIFNVKNYLLESSLYVSRFCKLITEESDVFMQEFSTRILAELTKDLFGVEQLADTLDINNLFELMKSTDPDVKRNSIEIIYNLIQNPFMINVVVNCKDFSFKILYDLLNEPYRVIQELALDVIKCLLEKTSDDTIHEMFRKTEGVDQLFLLLEIDQWKDLHNKVLEIISISSENKKTAELIVFNGGVQKLLKYIEDTDTNKLYAATLSVLVSLTKTRQGVKVNLHNSCGFEFQLLKSSVIFTSQDLEQPYEILILHVEFSFCLNNVFQLLYFCEFVDHLLTLLQDKQQRGNYVTISNGIAQMSLYHLAAKDFTEKNVIQYLLEIMKDNTLEWNQRKSALLAIKQLISFDIKNCEKAVGLKILIREIIEEAPLEIQIICVQIIDILISYNQLRDFPVDEYINILCSTFDSRRTSADELKMLCCNAISNLLRETEKNDNTIFKSIIPQINRLLNLIKGDLHSLPVKNEAVKLIMQLCENKSVADCFIKSGCLIYMLQNRSPAKIIPLWDSCIETLLNSHLPSKFAYSGRLTFQDVTENGFYAMRRTTCPFPDLEEFFKMKMCPVEAIYVVNFSGKNINNGYESDEIDDARSALKRESLTKGITLTAEELESLLELKYGHMEADPDLCKYVSTIKCLISESEANQNIYEKLDETCELIDISKIVSRAKIIAEFVIRQMSEDIQPDECINHCTNKHLKVIKQHIKRNVIPLGRIKIGSHFERALLYKILADRVLLPAALVRDQYCKAWIEISVPQISDCTEISTAKLLPKKLLRSNYIVDLMNYPGELLLINSRKAQLYLDCEKQS